MSQFEKLQKAAALKYSPDRPESAPVVVASGAGTAARKIIGIAERCGVPVFRDDSLATLLSQLRAGTEIPPELYRAVVDIYLYFLGFTVNGRGVAVRGKPVPPGKEAAGGKENPAPEWESGAGTGDSDAVGGEAALKIHFPPDSR